MHDGSPNPIIHLTYGDKAWYLDLRQAGFDGIDPTTLDRKELHQWYIKVGKEFDLLPRSARYHNRKIVPHQLGRRVAIEELDKWADNIHHYMGQELPIPYQNIQPKLTVHHLKKLKQRLLASYTTWYNPHISNRTHNIELSTHAIDHVVVMPDETFSFNRTVGQRTISRGYKEAKVIVKGEYSEGVGGGICQTSSTLFNSVAKANLTVKERVSHSRHVPYVPNNRDATVSWGGPDFKFVNERKEPILIVSEAKNGHLTVMIYTANN